MITRRSILVFAVVLTLTSACGGSSQRYGGFYRDATDCVPTTQAELAELSVDRADVSEISYILRRVTQQENEVFDGYDVWVELYDCSGALVLELDSACFPRQRYTRGGCQIEGVKAF